MGLLPERTLVTTRSGKISCRRTIERVEAVEGRVRLLDSKRWPPCHDDHVARDRIERTEETLRMVAEVREGEA